MHKLYHESYNIIICGDINVNYLNDDSRKKQLDAILFSYNLIGIVTFPTRVDISTSTIIDNFFIDTTRIDKYDIYPLVNGLSDHDAQLLTLHKVQKQVQQQYTYMKRMINNDTIANFQLQLSQESWESVFDENDVNKSFNLFLNIILRTYYSSFPLIQKKSVQKNNTWITPGIMKSCKHKREIYNELRNNKDPNFRVYYRNYSKLLSTVIKKAKRMEYDKCILYSHNKIKTTWGIIKKEVGRSTSRIEISAVKIDGKILNNQQEVVGEFNKYFANVADKIKRHVNKNSIPMNDQKNEVNFMHYMNQDFINSYPNINYNCSTIKEIENIIKSLKPKNSCGYDEISSIILKLCSPFIISPINYICNKMLRGGVFPDRLKYAIINPLYKNGDTWDVTNYRPISLLTSFSKIFETIIYTRTLEHLNKYNILSSEQYGFRKGLKTDNAIYKLTTEILNSMNNKQLVAGVFCDLEKAFDCVDHDILLTKLKFYGITGKDQALYESYLSNRYIRTVIHKNDVNTVSSEWLNIRQGVPQGSVLGPLLFLIYINDLPKVLNRFSTPVIFADDTSILFSHSNINDLSRNILTTIEILNRWFRANKLSLNFNKTHCIQFKTKATISDTFTINYNNNFINNTLSTKFLGVVVDSALIWKNHIELLVKKLSKACYVIRNMKQYLSITALKAIYYSFFHSLLSYGIIFWGNSSHSSSVFLLQKKAIRAMLGYGNRVSCRNIFKELNILPFASQYIFSLLIFVLQNKHLFSSNIDSHAINTRHRQDLYLPQANLTSFQKGVYYAGIKMFNKLPIEIKNSSHNFKKFKVELRYFLNTHTFYTVEEYLNR